MSRPSRNLLRLPIQIIVWTLMVIALLGPHTPWSVCMTGKCSARTVAVASCCSCCHEGLREDSSKDEGRGKGDGENGAETCIGCCIDLATVIDEGPMPKPVSAPDVDNEFVAIVPAPTFDKGSAVAARLQGHDTGPPRVDRRTSLIATTILRE